MEIFQVNEKEYKLIEDDICRDGLREKKNARHRDREMHTKK